jgi:hypothetical protein
MSYPYTARNFTVSYYGCPRKSCWPNEKNHQKCSYDDQSTFFILGFDLSFTALGGKVQILDPKVSFQAVHCSGQRILTSGTNGGIYQSTDNAQHWNKSIAIERFFLLRFWSCSE